MSVLEIKKEMKKIRMDIVKSPDTALETTERGFRDKMFDHFKNGDFCDVILEAGKDKKKFSIHRVVLSAASDYFSALFGNETKEKYQAEILLEDITGDTLLNLIEYCYKGEIVLTEHNVDSLLAAAHMLRFTELEQQCTEYYKYVLNTSNCIGIWALAKLYDFDSLINLASKLAFDNFMDVVKSDEFKYMEIELLSEFLSSDNVNVDSEEDVFRALVIWMEFDLTKRLPHLQNLMGTIRVGQLHRSFLEGALLIWCQQLNDFQLYGNLLNRHSTGQSSARKSTAFGRLFAIGGSKWDEENDCLSIERYCPLTNKWKRFHDIPSYRHFCSTVHINNNELIIIGGRNKLNFRTATVECLDLKTLTVKDLQPMRTARYGSTAVFSEGYIYAIGGFNDEGFLSSVERYEEKSNQWTEVASMTEERMAATTAILSGAIFVIGAMNEVRFAADAGVANNILYVYGGFYDGAPSDTIEKYDSKEDKWTLLTFKLQIPRIAFASSIYKDWLIVMGGETTLGKKINSLEKINLITGESVQWSPMVLERSYFHVAHFPPIDQRTSH